MSIALSRTAFLVLAASIAAASLLIVDAIGTRALETRVGRSLAAITDAGVVTAEASLDFGLPINGPGSVNEQLQPPRLLSKGPDALSFRLESLQASGDAQGDTADGTPHRLDGAMVATRPVSDSHGETAARLVVSRSMAGFDAAAAGRQTVILLTLLLSVPLLAALLASRPPWTAIRLPACVFGTGVLVLLHGFGSQALAISQQGAMLALTDTANATERAVSLGIPFGDLVAMPEYLERQIATKSAVGALTVRDAAGIAYEVRSDGVGSMLARGVKHLPLWFVADLVIEENLKSGVSLTATIDLRPVLTEVTVLAGMMLTFAVGGGAMLGSLWPRNARPLAETAGATLPSGLFLLILFLSWSGGATVVSWPQFMWVTLAFAAGLATPLRLGAWVAAGALCAGVAGLWIDAVPAMAGAALVSGCALRWSAAPAKAIGLAAGLLPAVLAAGATTAGYGITTTPFETVAVLALALVVYLLRPKAAAAADAMPPRTLVPANWPWLCVFVMQLAGFVLIGLAARQMPPAFFGGPGPALYVLLCLLVYVCGGWVTGLHAVVLRARWISYELAVLAVVLAMAHAYAGHGSVLLDTALAAFFMGAIGRLNPKFHLVVGAQPSRSARIVALAEILMLGLAFTIAMTIPEPQRAALPATLLYLVMLAPLAFVTLTTMSVGWRRIVNGSAGR